MKIKRFGVASCLLAGVLLTVVACGGGDSSKASGSGSVECGGKQKLTASGSTAQSHAIEQFAYAYIRACPDYTIDYRANGSGTGIAEFASGQTNIAGSDSPLDASTGEPQRVAARCGSTPWHLPTVFGPIAVTYNIAGLSELNLDGPALAKIFNGTITSWDDPALQALNPHVQLPAQPIQVVYRSDKSGTTDNFQKYLDVASDGAWGHGSGKVFNGGTGTGAAGNDGTSWLLRTTDGAITYNEWSYAVGRNLSMARIVTSAGPEPVAISVESVDKTIEGAKFSGSGNDLVVDTASFYKPTTPGAYPIVLVTYEIVCSKYPNATTAQAVKAFMNVAITDGQHDLDQFGYIPLPPSFTEKLKTAIDAIT
ncbi:phosphate ABC transporter substrate-binding protein PstS [[Mycobacterium] kokjensenii]|uniref:Phosphate-binding protein n=1 Tax=[Mycobacterium] kokjensenii TaxID=3064287 RepID=A0ABM9LS47_9MYCO|nr:phosphate ABC transporter substrate-binding protein PstS [Mycolicibacter sp. MU0083]CAJ1503799.1 phosphate ABC transporter substrate-binding protein PstS [Mycolicibacter sp. MU0083]